METGEKPALINPVGTGFRAGRGILPTWFAALGWFALIGTVFSSLFPGTQSLFNIASGLGLVALIIYALQYRRPELVAASVFLAFSIFFLIALLTAIIPNYPALPDYRPMSQSFHALWNTAQAAIAAGLALVLIRRRRDLNIFLLLFTLTILSITVFSPFLGFMKDGLALRLTGTKGGANRYAIMLLVSSLPIWMLVLSKGVRELTLPGWARLAGWVVLIISPGLQLRQALLKNLDADNFFPANNTLPIILILISAIVVVALWVKAGKHAASYRIIGALALLGVYANLFLSGSRLALALALLILFCVALWMFRKNWLRCLLVAGLLLWAIGGSAYLLRSEHFAIEKIKLDFKVRQFIWRGAEEIFKENPVFGCGYGTKSFYRNWPYAPPYGPELSEFNLVFSHAHNLWRHLLATQGILGFLAFHGLWLAVVFHLSRPVRKKIQTSAPGPSFAYATLGNTPVLFIAFLGMLMLQLNGILTLPLQGCNEILYWLVAALGLAGLKLSTDNN